MVGASLSLLLSIVWVLHIILYVFVNPPASQAPRPYFGLHVVLDVDTDLDVDAHAHHPVHTFDDPHSLQVSRRGRRLAFIFVLMLMLMLLAVACSVTQI